jgi:type IX secretion system PorP/SprF family membrane protein
MQGIKKYLVLVYACLLFTGHAQDFQLSMYDAAPLFLNPAMTGLMDSKVRFHAQYRNQWNAVAYKPLTTALVSFDVPKGKWGIGGQITNMRAGLGNYNALQILGSLSYCVALDKKKYHNLSFGLQAGVTQKRIEYQVLTFDSQWTTANGGSFNRDQSSGENFGNGVQFQEAVNFGALYFFGKQQSRINPFVGASFFNLTRPREQFVGSDNRLPIRSFYHAGVRLNVSELFYFIPKALFYTQAGQFQQTYAVDAGYFFKGERFFALGGYLYRTGDASVAYLGLKKDNYIIKLSYDFNTSSLRTVSKTRGAYELSFTWLGKKNKNNEVKNCPRL